MKSTLFSLIFILGALSLWGAKPNMRAALGVPDIQAIATASVDPTSEYYYPKLLAEFQRNDTTMSNEAFQYFYYGTMFQEDYDPYREAPAPALLQELLPIYAKQTRTRAERNKMLDYADMVLASNPIDLRQLTNRIYVYEQNGKYDLAKIWQFKLNHILLVIAASGNGSDPQNAFVVVYPQHEYDFLNLSGHTATTHRFEAPYYDYIATTRGENGAENGFYFNISELLNQYFLKHPGELEETTAADK